MQNSFKEVKPLPLWSWQQPGYSLTEGTVDHQRSDWKTLRGYPESIKDLSERLGTDQFVWCYTRGDEHDPLHSSASVEWQLEVPKHHVLAFICSFAWHWILARNGEDSDRPDIRPVFWRMIKDLSKWHEFEERFYDFWRNKTLEELWDALFLDEVVRRCTHVLLRHPIENSWVIHAPKQ